MMLRTHGFQFLAGGFMLLAIGSAMWHSFGLGALALVGGCITSWADREEP
jgi:hypothetical protein